MVTSINDLNDDCVIEILSYLPVLDRFRSYRVCKRWNVLCRVSWKNTKSLNLRRDLWGLGKESSFIVNRKIFVHLLEICGRYLVHVDLTNVDRSGLPDANVRVKSCKSLFTAIKKHCPNVKSINAGEPCSDCTLDYLASHFNELSRFAVKITESYENLLALMFYNNKNLKRVRLEGCRITGICLLSLNAEALEEFHFIDNQVNEPQHLIDALESFKNVRTLNLTRIAVMDHDKWMDPITEALRRNAASVKTLSLKFYENWMEYIDFSFVSDFVNLEKLHVDGPIIVNDKFLAVVGDNCKKLISLQLLNSTRVTDDGITSIVTNLPALRYLYLNSLEQVTDKSLSSITQLRALEVRRCPNVGVDGLVKLIKTSPSLTTLWCTCCGKITADELFEPALDLATKESRCLTIRLDNSDDEDSKWVTDVQALFTSEDRILHKVRRLCYECFKAPRTNCKVCCNVESQLTSRNVLG